MEKKNDQHTRQKFIEEQLSALKQEEKALNEARLTLLNQRWQVQSENDKLQRKLADKPEEETTETLATSSAT